MKKILSFVFSLAMFLSISAPALADSLDTKPSDAEIYRYLIDAGYSEEFIEALDDELRLEYYEGQYQFESAGTTRGIFTEDHKVEFSVDDSGKIVIDEQNLRNLEAFLNDKASVEKVLESKVEADETFALSSATGDAVLSADDVDGINANAIINAVDRGEIPVEIMTLTNWNASITCSHISYNKTTKEAKKKLTYTWKWSYAPFWNLTDKAAMAWNGGFVMDETTFYWTYVRRVRYSNVYRNHTESGHKFNECNLDGGVAKAIDIKAAGAGASTKYHSGSISANIIQKKYRDTRCAAIGRYYHKQITATLALSFGTGSCSITVSNVTGKYDQSSDSMVSFWATNAN